MGIMTISAGTGSGAGTRLVKAIVFNPERLPWEMLAGVGVWRQEKKQG